MNKENEMMMNESEKEMNAHILVTEAIGAGAGAIAGAELSQEDAEREAEEIVRYMKSIDVTAPAVCIDGRPLAEGETEIALGAHISGGAESILTVATSLALPVQGKALVDALGERGYTLGAHDADSNKAAQYETGTGCGAHDKNGVAADLFNENHEAVQGTVQALMGDDFDTELYASVQLSPSSEALSDVVAPENIETLHDDHQGVHGHQERIVVFNYKEGTTVDREAYVEATGKQAFVVDMWYLKDIAGEMAAVSEVAGETVDKAALYHALTAFQVGVYLALCDGSHRAVLVS